MIRNVQTLRGARPDDLAFFDDRTYAGQLAGTLAGACVLAGANAKRAPGPTATLTTANRYSAFARASRLFYADAAAEKAANAKGTLVDAARPFGNEVTSSQAMTIKNVNCRIRAVAVSAEQLSNTSGQCRAMAHAWRVETYASERLQTFEKPLPRKIDAVGKQHGDWSCRNRTHAAAAGDRYR